VRVEQIDTFPLKPESQAEPFVDVSYAPRPWARRRHPCRNQPAP